MISPTVGYLDAAHHGENRAFTEQIVSEICPAVPFGVKKYVE